MSFQIYSMAGSFYNDMIRSRTSSLGFVELLKKDIYSFEMTHNQSSRVQVSSQSVDRVWAVQREDDFDTQQAPIRVAGCPRSINSGLTAAGGTAFAAQEALVTNLAVSEFDSYGRFGATEKYNTAFFDFTKRTERLPELRT